MFTEWRPLGFAVLVAAAAAILALRKAPALLVLPALALAIACVCGVPAPAIGGILSDGAVRLAPVIVALIAAATLGRVLTTTGIAARLVAYAAEYGGDNPIILGLLISLVVALLFTTLSGLGAIILVGSVVIPVLLAAGLPRVTTAAFFLWAFSLGFIFNIAQWTFYYATFGVVRAELMRFAIVLAVVDTAVFLVFAFREHLELGRYAYWAVAAPPEKSSLSPFALATPLIAPILFLCSGAAPITAFSLASIYGVASAAPKRPIETLTAAFIRGIEDSAPAIALFLGIGILLETTHAPEVGRTLTPLIGLLTPHSPLAYVIVFGVLSPLALYRGPLNPFGVGIVLLTLMSGASLIAAPLLVAGVMAVVAVQNACDPTNTQNVWTAGAVGATGNEILAKILPYKVAVAVIATTIAMVFMPTFFGAQVKLAGSVNSVRTNGYVIARAMHKTGSAITPPDETSHRVSARHVYFFRELRTHVLHRRPDNVAQIMEPTADVVRPNSTAAVVAAAHPAAVDIASTPAAVVATSTSRAGATAPTATAPAANAKDFPGLAAPDDVAGIVRVVAPGTVFGAIAERALTFEIGLRPGMHAVHGSGVSMTDCAHARAAANLRVTIDAQIPNVEIGLELLDCAGWPVTVVHINGVTNPLTESRDVAQLTRAAMQRLRYWALAEPARAEALFDHGVAFDGVRDAPTYYFGMVKTTDGNLRVIVRPGGPAWNAGLRSNDIIDKIDNAFWWEYGTYQSQAKAYDLKPHAFDIHRGKIIEHLELHEPLYGV